MQRLVIIGAGGHAREVLDVVDAINQNAPPATGFEMLGYIVEGPYATPGEQVQGFPVLGDFEWLVSGARDVHAVCAVGAPELRRRLVSKAQALGVRFATLVHPQAVRTRWITMGQGVVIAAGCVLTNQIRIGDHVHINVGCTIAHDSVLEDFATLAPGVHSAGTVMFGVGCNVGVGASITPRRRIGAWSIVGAGTVVTDDAPANSTVIGAPGRVVKRRDEGWHLSP